MFKRHIAIGTIGFAMLATTAIAQTSAPSPAAPSATPAPSTAAPAPAATKDGGQNLAMPGKWRASKLMGVDIYGADKKKVGEVTEVVFDKAGMVETVTVGVGGFLGIGAKDVAIPFGQITWSDQPMEAGAPAPAGGSTSTSGTASTPVSAAPAANTAKAPTMYPDHGMISMTKEQLTSAPAVSFSGS
jgi:sporulation protein YlmC with PRC-barrel domain